MKRKLAVGLLLAAVLLTVSAVLTRPVPPEMPAETLVPEMSPAPESTSVPAPSLSAPEETPTPAVQTYQPGDVVDGIKVGGWTVTAERKEYEDGELRLIIPALDVDVPVLDGTDADTLLRGVGLYEYAQLPGEGNRNVSIAGHRNGLRNGRITDNMPFYYLDTLEEGNYLYLSDTEYLYRYLFSSATVVEADDWSVIAATGNSCLTLTTCTPIGVADHRLVIRAALDETLPAGDTTGLPTKEKSA